MKEMLEQALLPQVVYEQASVELIRPERVGRWKVYAEYKDSGVERLGEIPEHWEVRRIKYLAQLVSEKLFKKPDDLPYIGLEQIEPETGKLIENEPVENVESTMGYFNAGDVLFGKLRPYLAKVVLATFEGVCTTELLVLRPNKCIHGRYFQYRLLSKDLITLVTSFTYGTKMPRASSDQVCNIALQLPTLSEQQATASFLDRETTRINTLIAKKEQHIALLQERRTAIINQAVTKGLNADVSMKDSGIEWLGKIPEHWEAIKIKRLCIVKRGASPRPIDDQKYFDDNGEYAWVRISDVTASNRYLRDTEQRLSPLGANKSVKLQSGELFLSIAGSVGKAIITDIKCCIHDGFVYFVGLKENREYLYYIFSCGELYKGLGKWGTQLNLNTDTIGDIYIPVPSVEEQQTIVAYIEQETTKIDKLITGIQESIKKLKEYSTALISATVTGQIDVRGEVAADSAEDATI